MTHLFMGIIGPRFSLGALYATTAAERTLVPEDMTFALARHRRGDWGDVCTDDRTANEQALASGGRLFSVYHDRNGTKFWIITEADRSSTTVLLPDDY